MTRVGSLATHAGVDRGGSPVSQPNPFLEMTFSVEVPTCTCYIRGVGCGVVNKGHICRFLKYILVVWDGGNERVDSVICLCARFGDKFVRGESVVGLGMCRNTV